MRYRPLWWPGVLVIGSYMHIYSLRMLFVIGVLVNGFGLYMTSTVTSLGGFYSGMALWRHWAAAPL